MGSGKSLLAEIISLITTGRLPANMPQSKDPDEDRKKILSLLMSGDPLILIDNCERPICGGALCMILTQEYYQDRILSQNKMARVNTGVMIMATGNNLQFLGDMTTRALLCTIDLGMERPEERQFRVKNIRELETELKKIDSNLNEIKQNYEREDFTADIEKKQQSRAEKIKKAILEELSRRDSEKGKSKDIELSDEICNGFRTNIDKFNHHIFEMH